LRLHQNGHNSGVIHAGVYYAPGRFERIFVKGERSNPKAFCFNDIEFDECGQVASSGPIALEHELWKGCVSALPRKYLELHKLDQAQLKEREPNIKGVSLIRSFYRIVTYSKDLPETCDCCFTKAGGECV